MKRLLEHEETRKYIESLEAGWANYLIEEQLTLIYEGTKKEAIKIIEKAQQL